MTVQTLTPAGLHARSQLNQTPAQGKPALHFAQLNCGPAVDQFQSSQKKTGAPKFGGGFDPVVAGSWLASGVGVFLMWWMMNQQDPPDDGHRKKKKKVGDAQPVYIEVKDDKPTRRR